MMWEEDKPVGKYEIPKDKVYEIMDKALILHADHEQNCSTSTVRMVGSSKANTVQAISAGVNALATSYTAS